MTLLSIAQLGQKVLREKAKSVENVEEIQTLIDDMLATLKDFNGVGLAAPQVYQSLRLFIVASHPNPRYLDAPKMRPTPMINPKIIDLSGKIIKDWEGCLSIPGVRARVPRYTRVKIKYTDKKGKIKTGIYEDFIAKIVQHEYDHLEGLVFLDRVESSKDIITEKEFQRIVIKASKKQRHKASKEEDAGTTGS